MLTERNLINENSYTAKGHRANSALASYYNTAGRITLQTYRSE